MASTSAQVKAQRQRDIDRLLERAAEQGMDPALLQVGSQKLGAAKKKKNKQS